MNANQMYATTDERTALTEALAILRALAAGAKPDADAGSHAPRHHAATHDRYGAGNGRRIGSERFAGRCRNCTRRRRGIVRDAGAHARHGQRCRACRRRAPRGHRTSGQSAGQDLRRSDAPGDLCGTMARITNAARWKKPCWPGCICRKYERKDATIQVNIPNGPLYTAAEIDRLHIEAKYHLD